MSVWKRSGLCLCRSDDLAGAGQCLHSESRQRSSISGLRRIAAGEPDFPFMTLCQRALKRRLKGTRAQTLILHDRSGACGVSKAEADSKEVWAKAVEVCSLDRISHVDILLVLAMGFDRVLLQQLTAEDSAALQAHEINVARAMGGAGRLDLFASTEQLQSGLAAVPATAGPWQTAAPASTTSRPSTARACAAVLLPDDHEPVPLPIDAPYGTVQLNASACNMCQSCVWLCPTDALSVGGGSSELLFVESSCIQCGMCKSICPKDALHLDPRHVSPANVDTQRSLHRATSAACNSCGDPFTVKPVLDRLLNQFRGGKRVLSKADAQRLSRLCSSCRAREIKKLRDKRLAEAGLMHSEPLRGL